MKKELRKIAVIVGGRVHCFMIQNLLDSHGTFYAGNHLDRLLMLLEGFGVDIEYALQALSPGHCRARPSGRV